MLNVSSSSNGNSSFQPEECGITDDAYEAILTNWTWMVRLTGPDCNVFLRSSEKPRSFLHPGTNCDYRIFPKAYGKQLCQMKGTVGVINGPESHSGMSSLRQLISSTHTGGDFFAKLKISGSHEASLHMIRTGQADVAAIDSVVLSLIERYRPDDMQGFRVLGTTYRAPAPPFVVRAHTPAHDVERIRSALLETFVDPATAQSRRDMLLDGAIPATSDDYWIMNAFEDYATNRGFEMVHETNI